MLSGPCTHDSTAHSEEPGERFGEQLCDPQRAPDYLEPDEEPHYFYALDFSRAADCGEDYEGDCEDQGDGQDVKCVFGYYAKFAEAFVPARAKSGTVLEDGFLEGES